MTGVRERTFLVRPRRCNLCNCDLIPRQNSRGLCRSHYQAVWKLVEIDQEFTWEQLEAAGIVNRIESVKAQIIQRLAAQGKCP